MKSDHVGGRERPGPARRRPGWRRRAAGKRPAGPGQGLLDEAVVPVQGQQGAGLGQRRDGEPAPGQHVGADLPPAHPGLPPSPVSPPDETLVPAGPGGTLRGCRATGKCSRYRNSPRCSPPRRPGRPRHGRGPGPGHAGLLRDRVAAAVRAGHVRRLVRPGHRGGHAAVHGRPDAAAGHPDRPGAVFAAAAWPWPCRASVWGLLAIALAAGLASSAGGAQWGLVSEILPADRYILGRSLLNMSVGVMQILGYAVGGALVDLVSPRGALLVAAALYLASSAGTWLGLSSRRPPRVADGRRSGPTWVNHRLWSHCPPPLRLPGPVGAERAHRGLRGAVHPVRAAAGGPAVRLRGGRDAGRGHGGGPARPGALAGPAGHAVAVAAGRALPAVRAPAAPGGGGRLRGVGRLQREPAAAGPAAGGHPGRAAAARRWACTAPGCSPCRQSAPRWRARSRSCRPPT